MEVNPIQALLQEMARRRFRRERQRNFLRDPSLTYSKVSNQMNPGTLRVPRRSMYTLHDLSETRTISEFVAESVDYA